MREQGVGSVVVVDQRSRPVGIFTKHDLVRVFAEDLRGTPVSAAMTRDPIALPAHALAYEAALAMVEQRVRHVLVTEDGKLVGVISERDLFSLQRLGLAELTMEIRLAARHRAARAPCRARSAGSPRCWSSRALPPSS